MQWMSQLHQKLHNELCTGWQSIILTNSINCSDLAAHDHDDVVAGDGGHWRWWGLSKSHAWYYRWNERPPAGLIIRPGSPLIYRLSRTSPLLLLLHCFIICWIAQTSSLLFFHSTSTSLSTVSHWPWLQVSQHNAMVAWCIYQVSACFFLLPLESARSVFVDQAPQPSLDNQSMLEHSLLEHNIWELYIS